MKDKQRRGLGCVCVGVGGCGEEEKGADRADNARCCIIDR